MKISRAAAALLLAACPSLAAARRLQGGDCTFFAADGTPRQGGDGTTPECTLEPIPLNKKDFDEPDWEAASCNYRLASPLRKQTNAIQGRHDPKGG